MTRQTHTILTYTKHSMTNYHLPSEVCDIINDYAKPIGIRLDWRSQPTHSCLAILASHKWNKFSKRYLISMSSVSVAACWYHA